MMVIPAIEAELTGITKIPDFIITITAVVTITATADFVPIGMSYH